MKQPWGGRFKESTDELMLRFSSSIFFDKRLYAYDIEGDLVSSRTPTVTGTPGGNDYPSGKTTG